MSAGAGVDCAVGLGGVEGGVGEVEAGESEEVDEGGECEDGRSRCAISSVSSVWLNLYVLATLSTETETISPSTMSSGVDSGRRLECVWCWWRNWKRGIVELFDDGMEK